MVLSWFIAVNVAPKIQTLHKYAQTAAHPYMKLESSILEAKENITGEWKVNASVCPMAA